MAERIEGLDIGLKLDHAQVEQGLTGLKRELKTANAEMKNQLSAFDYSERSIGKYQTKLESLNRKHEAQARVTEESRKKYEDMVEQYGEGSRQAQNAERDLNNQEAALGNLDRSIESTEQELQDLQEEQQIANSNWTKTGDKLQEQGDKLESIGGKVSGFGDKWTKASGIAVGAIGGVGAAVFGLTNKVTANAEEMDIQAQTMGISTQAYQEMKYWADENGVSQQQVEKIVGRLNQRMGEAKEGNDKYADALEDLGISMSDVEDGTISTEDAFTTSIQTLSEMEDEHEKVAKATELFGTRTARTLLPALEDGSLSMEEAKEKAEELGIVMSDDQIEASKEFQKQYREIKDSMQSVAQEVAMDLMPYMEDGMDWVMDNVPEIKKTVTDSITNIVDTGQDIIDWYKDLSPEAKKAVKYIGLISTVGGPVVGTLGRLTSGIGGLASGVGKVASGLGKKGGVGAIGRLGMLGKAGVAGLAIGGVAALAGKVVELTSDKKDLNDVSLDTVDQMEDEHEANQDMIDRMDELRDETNWTNDQFKDYLDLQSRLEDETDEESIEKIKGKMADLKKESGFSNDEIDEMVDLNKDLVEKLPDSTSEITEQGEKVAGTTKKMQDYNDELKENTQLELEGKWYDALENEEILQGKIVDHYDKRNFLKEKEDKVNDVLDNFNEKNVSSLKEEISDENTKIQKKMQSSDIDEDQRARYAEKLDVNRDILDSLGDGRTETSKQLNSLKQQNNEEGQKLEKTEDEMGKLDVITDRLKTNKLTEEGISSEKAEQAVKNGEEFEAINDQINKLEDKKGKLKENHEAGELSTSEYRKGVDEIDNQIDSLNGTKGSINDLQLQAGDLNVELGKDASKRVDMYENGLDGINAGATESKSKKVALYQTGLAAINRDASKAVRKKINFEIGSKPATTTLKGIGAIPAMNAKGDSNHPGGPSILGDGTGSNEGSEMVNLPSGKSFMSANKPTLYPDLPKGTEVLSAKNTRRVLSGIPKYANGTESEFAKLMALSGRQKTSTIEEKSQTDNLLAEQNKLLTQLLNKDSDFNVDGISLAKVLKDPISELQNKDKRIKEAFQ